MDCVKDHCKNKCREAADCFYDKKKKWKKVIDNKCGYDI
jgi:hypothetical protein